MFAAVMDSPSFGLSNPGDQPTAGRQGISKADGVLGSGERDLPHEFAVLVRPECFPLQPVEHHGEPFGGCCRCAAPSPSGVGGSGLPHQPSESGDVATCVSSAARSCRCRMMVGSSFSSPRSPRAYAPGERAQLVGGRLDRIDAGEGGHFGRLLLELRDQRADRALDRHQHRGLHCHLDAQMRAQPLPCPEFSSDTRNPPRRSDPHRPSEPRRSTRIPPPAARSESARGSRGGGSAPSSGWMLPEPTP